MLSHFSLDMSPCDFCLFPRVKYVVKGILFELITDIQSSVMRIIQDLSVFRLATFTAKFAKTIAKCKKQKVYSGVFRITFSEFYAAFFAFCTGLIFVKKVKGFRGLFFCGINKIRNLHEIRKVYRECFVFRGMFCEMRNEKCIAGFRSVMKTGQNAGISM